MKTVSIIRQRGQLTIPDSIRRVVNWVAPLSAVSITVLKPDEIRIKPHKTQVDWDKIWDKIEKSRSQTGKGHMNTSEFLGKDRLSH